MDRRKLPDFLSFFFRSFSRPPVPAPLDLARPVVFGAVDYARLFLGNIALPSLG